VRLPHAGKYFNLVPESVPDERSGRIAEDSRRVGLIAGVGLAGLRDGGPVQRNELLPRENTRIL
jgi:hypothetical protein